MVNRIPAKRDFASAQKGCPGEQSPHHSASHATPITAVYDAADQLDIDFEDIADMDDADVYALLFPGRGDHTSVFVQPDWAQVHKELAKGCCCKVGAVGRAT